jgi:WD40 repeat protein
MNRAQRFSADSLLLLSMAFTLASPSYRADAVAPPGVSLVRDSLPPAALARFGTARLRHPGIVKGVTFSPNGQRLFAGAGSDRNTPPVIWCWGAATGRLIRRFGDEWAICAMALAPDGKTLALAAAGSLVLFDPATGKRLRVCGITPA